MAVGPHVWVRAAQRGRFLINGFATEAILLWGLRIHPVRTGSLPLVFMV
jgi:hypothetical protein